MARTHSIVGGALVACSLFGVVGRASAEQPASEAPASSTPAKDEPKSEKKLTWTGTRFRSSEYLVTGALLLGAAGATFYKPKNDGPSWRGGVLMDDAVVGVARANDASTRQTAAQVSDYMLYGMIAWPYLDAGIAWGARGNADVAWQMALVNTEAFAFTGLTTTVVKLLTKRERPWAGHCTDANDPACSTAGASSDSFMSGHTSMAFTSAGLTCAHHTSLGLYGNPYADGAACVGALGLATVTGALRIVSDKHYTTDVFAGAALGLASGYLIPKLLHYGFGSSPAKTKDEVAKTKPKKGIASWSAAPSPVAGGAVVSVSGIFF